RALAHEAPHHRVEARKRLRARGQRGFGVEERRHGWRVAVSSDMAVGHRAGPRLTQPVLRFAPSPNGRLHLGHAYSALLNAELARCWNGRFLLRIEDIDVTRCRPEFEAGVLADLAWLGLAWEQPVRRQSEH